MTVFLLIRHGLTDWNVQHRWQGHADIPLNEVGQQQAQALAQRLVDWPIQAIYSSDLQRAAATAHTLGQALGLSPSLTTTWRERDVGLFQGLTSVEAEAQFGAAWARWRAEGAGPPEGESDLAVAERVVAAFTQLKEEHAGEMIAIVSHGGTLAMLLAYLLGFPLGQNAPISLRANTGLSVVRLESYGPRILLLNDSAHLGDEALFQIVTKTY